MGPAHGVALCVIAHSAGGTGARLQQRTESATAEGSSERPDWGPRTLGLAWRGDEPGTPKCLDRRERGCARGDRDRGGPLEAPTRGARGAPGRLGSFAGPPRGTTERGESRGPLGFALSRGVRCALHDEWPLHGAVFWAVPRDGRGRLRALRRMSGAGELRSPRRGVRPHARGALRAERHL